MAVQFSPRIDEGPENAPHSDTAPAAYPLPAEFPAELFGRAVPDDLARFSPEQLAAVGTDSWAFLATRSPGTAKVRLASHPAVPGVTVLDIANDDMPFLVDSVAGELHERGLAISLLVHPIFSIDRDAAGNLIKLEAARDGAGRRESFIHIHIDGLADAAAREDLGAALEAILAEVRVSVADWQPSLARVREVIADLRQNPSPLPAPDIAEAIQFLEWLAGDNFTLLGARDYTYTNDDRGLQPMFETGLGLLRSPEMRLLRRGTQLVTVTPEIREFLEEPRMLIVAKAAVRARVHRRVHLDYVGVKRFDADGKLIGERRFCGLFTSTAYTRSNSRHPLPAPQGRQRHPPRGVRALQPFR